MHLTCRRFINLEKVQDHDSAVTAGRPYLVAMNMAESDKINLILVMSKRKELALDVSCIPNCD